MDSSSSKNHRQLSGPSNMAENDASPSNNQGSKEKKEKGKKDGLYDQLWHACAGPMVTVPTAGQKVFYFPQGHIEQVEAYTNKDGKVEMPIYNLPSKILCNVVNVLLKAEAHTDEVFAQITLLPVQDGLHLEHGTSRPMPPRVNAFSFSKKLTPSDTSTHGGFSVPKRYADACFPPLDMSQEPPAQELVAKDLHGSEWRFRHIYRGQPKRHLLTSGWSTFVNTKKLVAGDSCTFLRGENGVLYVGVCRATKPQTNMSASVLSGHSIQHGILACATHAFSTGTMFTVYYRPWTSPAEYMIPYDRYMESAENDYSIGTRFTMQLGHEECPEKCPEKKCLKFAGTVVGIDSIDCIRWPGSEWRCLKVQWDAASETSVCPERVSPWNIELVEVKRKNCTFPLPHAKRACPLDFSTPVFPVSVSNGLVKDLDENTQKRQLEVLQGQEIGAIDAREQGASVQPLLSHLIPQPNPNQHHKQVGFENRLHLVMHDPFYNSHGTILVPGENPPNRRPVNYWHPAFAYSGAPGRVEMSRNLLFPEVRFSSSLSQDWKASEEEDENGAPVGQPNFNEKYRLFGVNIFDSPQELHSQEVVSSGELHTLCPAPPVVSQSSISAPIPVFLPSKNMFGDLAEKQCKNCCSIAHRSCTKVRKHGNALGRSVDLARFGGYTELICELDRMFDFKGTLIDVSSGWCIIYTVGEDEMLLLGDYPWPQFQAKVRKMFLCPKEDVDKLGQSSPDPPSS